MNEYCVVTKEGNFCDVDKSVKDKTVLRTYAKVAHAQLVADRINRDFAGAGATVRQVETTDKERVICQQQADLESPVG